MYVVFELIGKESVFVRFGVGVIGVEFFECLL